VARWLAAPFPHPAHRTVQADFPHTALGQGAPSRGSHRLVSRRAVRAPGASEPLKGVHRLAPISRLSAPSARGLELGSLPSAGVTRLHRYYEPLRHPERPGLSLAGVRLKFTRLTAWGFPCCVGSPSRHAVATTPVGPLVFVASRELPPDPPVTAAFPVFAAGRLPHCAFRGLLGVHSCYGLPVRGVTQRRPFPSEASAVSLPPPPLRLLPAGATTVAGRDLHPPKIRAFFTAHTKTNAKLKDTLTGERISL
jgi:hypothetical protein